MPERTPMTANVEAELVEQLDERKRELDARDAKTVSRSDVVNEVLLLGLATVDILDDEAPTMHARERKHVVRQAMLDHFRASEE